MKKLLLIFCLLSGAAVAQTVYKTSTCINLPAVASRPLADKEFEIAATASSGMPVTFESKSLTVCTVTGAVVKLKAAGTCRLLAKSVLTLTHMAGQATITFVITADVTPDLPWTAQEKIFAACGPCPSTGKVESASCAGYRITSLDGGVCVNSQFCKWVSL